MSVPLHLCHDERKQRITSPIYLPPFYLMRAVSVLEAFRDVTLADIIGSNVFIGHIEFLDTRTRDNAQKQAAESVREESSEGDQELEGDQESSSEFREDEDEDAGTNAR